MSDNDKPQGLPTGKPHVSYSEMKDWMTCSYRHRLKHVDRIDLDKRTAAPVLGTAFHSAVEQRTNDPDRNVTDVDVIRERVVKDVQCFTDPDERERFDVDACVTTAVELSEEALLFLDANIPGWQLVMTEEPLYESISLGEAQHPDVSMKGFIDLVVKAKGKRGEDLVWILDWKTSSRPWGREKLSDPKVTYQLALYKSFWAEKHSVLLENVRCAYVVVLKAGKKGKRCQFLPVSVGPTTSKKTLTVLNNFVRSVKKGIAVKNKSVSNCQWCEYKNTKFCP